MTATSSASPSRVHDESSTTFGDRLADARGRLTQAGADSAWLTALVLLEVATGSERAVLLAHPEHAATKGQRDRFDALIERRCAREPLAQILGYRDFYGRRFAVSPAVLTPRPETEGLVDLALERLRALSRTTGSAVLDIGTGSGALAISILAERPDLTMVATDVSANALVIAWQNARLHDVSSRLRLVACDLASGIHERFPVVVANLPYVPSVDIDALEPEVARYEPRGALDGGDDGTMVIRRLIDDLGRLLAPGGAALVEIGEGQALGLTNAACDKLPGWAVRAERDSAGVERYLIVEHPMA